MRRREADRRKGRKGGGRGGGRGRYEAEKGGERKKRGGR